MTTDESSTRLSRGGMPPGLGAEFTGWVILAATVLLIAGATLFPFDFALAAARRAGRPFHFLTNRRDLANNILLFVPLGFALALLVKDGDRRRLAAAGIAGFCLSFLVETLQVFLSNRFPALADLAANTGGAVLGAVLRVAVARLRPAHPAAMPDPQVERKALAAILALLLALQIAFPVLWRDPGRLDSWDTSHVLRVGNDVDGGRRWLGQIWELHLFDRALDAPAALSSAMSSALSPAATTRPHSSLVLSYQTTGAAPFPDRSGLSPPLEDLPEPWPQRQGPFRSSDEHWLGTAGAVSATSRRIRDASQFTLLATLATRVPGQGNQRRIITIAGSPTAANLSLTQSGDDLFVRVRNGVSRRAGTRPAFRVRGVFADRSTKQLLITYDGRAISAWVDQQHRGRVRFSAEASTFWSLFPSSRWSFDIDASTAATHVFYRLLLLLPCALVLRRLGRGGPRWLPLACVVGLVLGNELLLTWANGQPPRSAEFLGGLLPCALAVLCRTPSRPVWACQKFRAWS